jgi:hypothetical protein
MSDASRIIPQNVSGRAVPEIDFDEFEAVAPGRAQRGACGGQEGERVGADKNAPGPPFRSCHHFAISAEEVCDPVVAQEG